jgi:RecB family exonuclease
LIQNKDIITAGELNRIAMKTGGSPAVNRATESASENCFNLFAVVNIGLAISATGIATVRCLNKLIVGNNSAV